MNITIFNTGFDANGNPLINGSIDPHYHLIGGTAYVVNNGTFPLDGNWLPDSSTSEWIGPSPSGGGAQYTTFDYQTTFDLTGFDPKTVTLTGSWAMDNEGVDILINGKSTGNVVNPPNRAGFQSFHQFTISSGFVPGVNTLDFIVHNDEDVTGLDVQISGTGSSSQPPVLTGVPGDATFYELPLLSFEWVEPMQL